MTCTGGCLQFFGGTYLDRPIRQSNVNWQTEKAERRWALVVDPSPRSN